MLLHGTLILMYLFMLLLKLHK